MGIGEVLVGERVGRSSCSSCVMVRWRERVGLLVLDVRDSLPAQQINSEKITG